MRALGDGTRLAIFERVCGREFTVGELTAHFDVSQPAVSQHLAVLKRCGLVRERREGRFARYRGRPEGLRPMVEWLGHFRKFWPEKLEALREMLEGRMDGVERGGEKRMPQGLKAAGFCGG